MCDSLILFPHCFYEFVNQFLSVKLKENHDVLKHEFSVVQKCDAAMLEDIGIDY
jgi:hypothetical protein